MPVKSEIPQMSFMEYNTERDGVLLKEKEVYQKEKKNKV